MPFPYARLIVGRRQKLGDGSAVSLRQINCRDTALPSPLDHSGATGIDIMSDATGIEIKPQKPAIARRQHLPPIRENSGR